MWNLKLRLIFTCPDTGTKSLFPGFEPTEAEVAVSGTVLQVITEY